MKVALVTCAYKEERYIKPFLKHIPDWVERKVVLNSITPWFGEKQEDKTAELAEPYAEVIKGSWKSEEDQRNFGLSINEDCDWVIILDPDEFLSSTDWSMFQVFLEETTNDAVICEGQNTYWKDKWVAHPSRDYKMLIAVRPTEKFVEKRVIGTGYVEAPVTVQHMSWRRTDEEVWDKISHYAHAEDFDIKKWYDEVWLKWEPGMEDVHPTTPDTLHKFVRDYMKMPPEFKDLGI